MIISKKYKFAFIHIPKCAGTTVRNILMTYDEKDILEGRHFHSELGSLDYNHIPLTILRKHFPKEYMQVKNYYSFAIIRNPFSRFPSSIKQRFKFKNVDFKLATKREIEKEVNDTIALLEKYWDAEILPPELIHFQRQYTYLYDNNHELVNNIFNIDDLQGMFATLEKRTGIKIKDEHFDLQKNKTPKLLNSNFRQLFARLPIPYKSLLVKQVPSIIKNRIKAAVYYNIKDLGVFESSFCKDFISSYYEKDLLIYNRKTQKQLTQQIKQ